MLSNPSEPNSLPHMLYIVQSVPTRAPWRLWYRRSFYKISKKRVTGNSVVSNLPHWYCEIDFVAVEFSLLHLFKQNFNIFGDVTPCVYTRRDHLIKSSLVNTIGNVLKYMWITSVSDTSLPRNPLPDQITEVCHITTSGPFCYNMD